MVATKTIQHSTACAMERVRRWSRRAAAMILAVGVVGPAVATAQQAPAPRTQPEAAVGAGTTIGPDQPKLQEDVYVRGPDSAPQPPPQTGLLETTFPRLREGMATLPPFFRDTDLNVRLRSFYFNRQNDDNTALEAWSLGGWVEYRSGWLADTFAIGASYFMSFPAYAPDTRAGSLLLTPEQETIGVFAEAWGALRYQDYVLLKGGRQRIDDGYVNPQDNRMLPNTFEAVMLSGALGWVRYDAGYIWTIKPRDSNDFISMSRQAGVIGDDKGLWLASLTLTPIKELQIYGGTFYADDLFNTFFMKTEYTHRFAPDRSLAFGVQFTDQRSVGDERLGDFTTWNVGVGSRLVWRGLSIGAAAHFTGDEASIRSPWGSWPGYLSLMVTDFDRANEKAYGAAVQYDFGGTLLPFQIPGLSVKLLYAIGTDRKDPATGRRQSDTHEGDLDVIYNVPAVKGLSLRFRNGYVGRGNDKVVKDFRIIVNYELDLL